MVEEKFLEVFSSDDFRKWLKKNHDKESKIGLIIHKKHTGKKFPTHKELMLEAICFGWIDTTIRRLDENRFVRFFSRRNKNSRWSYNTLSYGKKLLQEGRMNPTGLKFYIEGKKKLPHDYGIPKNPEIPNYMKKELENKNLLSLFEKLAPSIKKNHLRWVIRAKRDETKKRRIEKIIEEVIKSSKKYF